MKKIFLFLSFLAVVLTGFSQIKITQMPTYNGAGDSAWVAIVIGNVNYKIYGKNLTRSDVDSVKVSNDSVFYYKWNGIKFLAGVVNGGGSSSYAFSNGITETAGAVKLGAALTQNTVFSNRSFGFDFGTSASRLSYFKTYTRNGILLRDSISNGYSPFLDLSSGNAALQGKRITVFGDDKVTVQADTVLVDATDFNVLNRGVSSDTTTYKIFTIDPVTGKTRYSNWTQGSTSSVIIDSLTFQSPLDRVGNVIFIHQDWPVFDANRIQTFDVEANEPCDGCFLGFDSTNIMLRWMRPDSAEIEALEANRFGVSGEDASATQNRYVNFHNTRTFELDSVNSLVMGRSGITRLFFNSASGGVYSPDGTNSVQASDGVVTMYYNNGQNFLEEYADSTLSRRRISYPWNLHGTFNQFSLVDKKYVDSLVATVGGGTPGIDDVLAISQSITASRTLDRAGQNLLIGAAGASYVDFRDAYTEIQAYTDATHYGYIGVYRGVGGSISMLSKSASTWSLFDLGNDGTIRLGTNTGDAININNSNEIKFGAYGTGSITGTPAYGAAWDASGNLIEVALGGTDTNFGTDDITFTADRTHNAAANDLNITNLGEFKFSRPSNTAYAELNSSNVFITYGATGGDETFIQSGNGSYQLQNYDASKTFTLSVSKSTISFDVWNGASFDPILFIIKGMPVYADNAAAAADGKAVGTLYRTGDDLKIVH